MSSRRVVLTMIVKDEAHVLHRCFESVRPLIDAWCIVDTGSTDGTQSLIRHELRDLPGALYERPWVDFAHNRTEALDLARPHGDYSLMIDADTICELDPDVSGTDVRAALTADVYDVAITLGAIRYHRPQLTSTARRFSYCGVLHEALTVPAEATPGGLLAGLTFLSETDGARSRNPRKYHDDADVLEAALRRNDEPGLEPRYTFYLAQSYRDAGELEHALAAYHRRAAMTETWVEERAVAATQAGHLHRRLGHGFRDQLDAYLTAFDLAPGRAEAMCHAATAARAVDRLPTAFSLALAAWHTPMPPRGLFVEPDVYNWRLAYELGIASYYVGRTDVGAVACAEVLARNDVPGAERSATESNAAYYAPR